MQIIGPCATALIHDSSNIMSHDSPDNVQTLLCNVRLQILSQGGLVTTCIGLYIQLCAFAFRNYLIYWWEKRRSEALTEKIGDSQVEQEVVGDRPHGAIGHDHKNDQHVTQEGQ